MNDLTRRQLEMERRVYRLEDLADKELARSNAAMNAAEYLGNVLTLEWNKPPPSPPFVWKIKTLKAQASFDTPAVRYAQPYYASLQNAPLGSINYFNLHDGKVFNEMRREKSFTVESHRSSTTQYGHLNGERATDVTNPLNPVKDLTVWPWPFDPNITQPGVNWLNVWYATYLNDPAPDWFIAAAGSSAGWPPSQPLRPVGFPTIDWFGSDPQNTYSSQYGVAPREQYLYSAAGITPSYQQASHTVTWSHGNLYQPIEYSSASNVSWGDTSKLPANAFCGKIGAYDKYEGSIRRFYRAGAAVYFNAHAIPAGTLWQGGPGTVTIPATFIMLEIDPHFLEVPTAFTSSASVKLTWT